MFKQREREREIEIVRKRRRIANKIEFIMVINSMFFCQVQRESKIEDGAGLKEGKRNFFLLKKHFSIPAFLNHKIISSL
jgi:hypothetical protein